MNEITASRKVDRDEDMPHPIPYARRKQLLAVAVEFASDSRRSPRTARKSGSFAGWWTA